MVRTLASHGELVLPLTNVSRTETSRDDAYAVKAADSAALSAAVGVPPTGTSGSGKRRTCSSSEVVAGSGNENVLLGGVTVGSVRFTGTVATTFKDGSVMARWLISSARTGKLAGKQVSKRTGINSAAMACLRNAFTLEIKVSLLPNRLNSSPKVISARETFLRNVFTCGAG